MKSTTDAKLRQLEKENTNTVNRLERSVIEEQFRLSEDLKMNMTDIWSRLQSTEAVTEEIKDKKMTLDPASISAVFVEELTSQVNALENNMEEMSLLIDRLGSDAINFKENEKKRDPSVLKHIDEKLLRLEVDADILKERQQQIKEETDFSKTELETSLDDLSQSLREIEVQAGTSRADIEEISASLEPLKQSQMNMDACLTKMSQHISDIDGNIEQVKFMNDTIIPDIKKEMDAYKQMNSKVEEITHRENDLLKSMERLEANLIAKIESNYVEAQQQLQYVQNSITETKRDFSNRVSTIESEHAGRNEEVNAAFSNLLEDIRETSIDVDDTIESLDVREKNLRAEMKAAISNAIAESDKERNLRNEKLRIDVERVNDTIDDLNENVNEETMKVQSMVRGVQESFQKELEDLKIETKRSIQTMDATFHTGLNEKVEGLRETIDAQNRELESLVEASSTRSIEVAQSYMVDVTKHINTNIEDVSTRGGKNAAKLLEIESDLKTALNITGTSIQELDDSIDDRIGQVYTLALI